VWREEQVLKRGADARIDSDSAGAKLPVYTLDEIADFEEFPDAEAEQEEEKVVDQASAARTIRELEIEIGMLQNLERPRSESSNKRHRRKWDELSKLLQNKGEMFDAHGHRRKLVIFTEHRDTLNYLDTKIKSLLGTPEAIVTIHGSMGREDRKKAQESVHTRQGSAGVARDRRSW